MDNNKGWMPFLLTHRKHYSELKIKNKILTLVWKIEHWRRHCLSHNGTYVVHAHLCCQGEPMCLLFISD